MRPCTAHQQSIDGLHEVCRISVINDEKCNDCKRTIVPYHNVSPIFTNFRLKEVCEMLNHGKHQLRFHLLL